MYYAVTYGSIYLGGNIYLNFALVSLASIPSTFTSIICMNKYVCFSLLFKDLNDALFANLFLIVDTCPVEIFYQHRLVSVAESD